MVSPFRKVGMMNRRIAAQMARALAVGVGFALMGVGTAGQQVGRVPIELRVPMAPQPAVALGRTHLAYEVHITNFGTGPLRLDRLEVVTPDGTFVGAWSGAPLRQRVMPIGASSPADPAAPIPLAPGARAVAFLWLTLAPGQAVPSSLTHRLSISSEGPDPHVVNTAPVPVVASDHPAPLGSPVHGGPWVAVRGPSPSSGHRLSLVALDGVVRVPQRFAVDWVRLGDDGTLFRQDGADVVDWFSYDVPVFAVADATVVLVRDGQPDTTPRTAAPATVTASEAPGNVVVLDLGDGRFAAYAHLKAGSLVVTEGARVRAGQALARIGNSGNSLGPHLHFHVSTAVEPLGGEGLPFTTDQVELVGRVSGLAPLLAGITWAPQANQPARTVIAEMPLENMVVRFREE
jgi:murein DD-endopeptidase